MLKCCHLLSNLLLLTSILTLRLSTFMTVYHQEASLIAAEDASSKPWMTKPSHLHVQEELQVMQTSYPASPRFQWYTNTIIIVEFVSKHLLKFVHIIICIRTIVFELKIPSMSLNPFLAVIHI